MDYLKKVVNVLHKHLAVFIITLLNKNTRNRYSTIWLFQMHDNLKF